MTYEIAIIGAGPGGYVAAIRAAQLGAKVVLIEKEALGGTCLNKGCIPTKAMLSSVHTYELAKEAKSYGITIDNISLNIPEIYDRQKNIVNQLSKGLKQLLKSYKLINIITGEASIVDNNTIRIPGNEPEEIKARNIIIATGSSCADLGQIKVDHEHIINSDDALSLTEIPQKLAIIGGGAIGIEWARIYSAFGVDVTLIEMLDKIAPTCDDDISTTLLRLFKKNKIKVKTAVRVEQAEKVPSGVKLLLSNSEDILVNKVLLAVGRKPNSNIKGLNELEVHFNGPYIKANDFMQTNIAGIYAIGDVAGKLQLAHVASHEGIIAVETILGYKAEPINYSHVPFCIYGHPELASVGLTEAQARSTGIEIELQKSFYAVNGKAVAENEANGLVKTILDSKSKKVIGVHIIGAHASDMIHTGLLAVKNGLTKKSFQETIFAHPTLSEVLYESIVALHIPSKP